MDVHDGIVLPFVAIHLLGQSTRQVRGRQSNSLPSSLSQNDIPVLPLGAQPAWFRAQAPAALPWDSSDTDLIEMQPSNDVGLLCQLVNLLQEIHVANICRSV